MSIDRAGLEFVLRIDRATHERAPVVGRERELAYLKEEAEASSVAGRAIVIRGDAGVGKSALLGALIAALHDTHRVATGSCVELESRRPFAAFVEVLRSLERSISPRVAAIRDRGPELSALLDGRSLGTEVTTELERYGVDVAFMNVFEKLSRSRPLVIALEDMHWADEASTQLFAYLARRAANRPWLLIATVRSEIDLDHPFRHAIAELTTTRAVKEVVLRPLDATGTRALVAAELGITRREPGDLAAFADVIQIRSGGNPLFTEEILHALRDGGQLRQDGNTWCCARRDVELALPASIVDSVRARIARLGPDERRFVTVAAIAGDSVDLTLLQEVLGIDDAALTGALRAALVAALLVEGNDSAIRFRHALIRDAIERTLLGPERRQIHLRIAEVLESRPADAGQSGTLASHLDNAGVAERARQLYLDAAWHAVRSLETRSAVRMFERAAALTPEDHPRRAGTLEHLVRFLLATEQPERAEAAAKASLAAAERNHDPVGIGRALLAIARICHARLDFERAIELHDRAEAVLRPLGPSSDLALLHTARAWRALGHQDGATALREADTALTIAEAAPADDDPDDRIAGGRRNAALAAALNFGGCALLELERWDDALARLRRSYALARSSPDPATLHSSKNNLLVGLLGTGADPAELRRLWADLRTYRQTRARHPLALVTGLRDHMLLADFGAVRRGAEELTGAPRRIHSEARALVALAEIAQRGDPETYEDLAIARGELAEAGNAPLATFWAGLALVFAGRETDVGPTSSALMEVATGSTGPNYSAWASLVALAAARRAGHSETAEQAATAARDDAAIRALMYPTFRGVEAPFLRAESALVERHFDEAITSFDKTIVELELTSCVHIESLWLENLARLERAEALVRRGAKGDRAAAQADVDIVADYWRRAKADHFLSRLAEWAAERKLRVDLPRRVDITHAPSPLTSREDEVARLVAHGLTNREIAERLTLSVRTIESHVEQIRAKLEFHTRAQVAAWVVERYGSAG